MEKAYLRTDDPAPISSRVFTPTTQPPWIPRALGRSCVFFWDNIFRSFTITYKPLGSYNLAYPGETSSSLYGGLPCMLKFENLLDLNFTHRHPYRDNISIASRIERNRVRNLLVALTLCDCF